MSEVGPISSVSRWTFPRAPLLNPSAVMEISSGASTTAMSYFPSVQNTSSARAEIRLSVDESHSIN